jgi:phosphohistidine phosphatase
MLLYLMRHGIAVDHDDPSCPPDEQRPLTEEGRARTREVAQGLARLEVAVGLVISSPLLRAMQTAEIAAAALGVSPDRIRRSEALTPLADPRELLSELRKGAVRDVLCVGHAPNLDLVLTQAVAPRAAPIASLKKAGVACIELPSEPGQSGQLVWLMAPRALRLMGGRSS